MKKVRLFLVTFIMVMLIGGIAMLILPNDSVTASGRHISVADEFVIMDDKEEAQRAETITIDNPSINLEYSISDKRNVESITIAGAENSEEIEEEPVEEEPVVDYHVLYADSENTKVVDTNEEGVVTISFAGDILFDPAYSIYASFKQRGYDINQCFSEDLLNKMRSADIMMINNEFPYSYGGQPQPNKTFTFRADPSSVGTLFELGVDIVSIANNHTFDYGEEAFLDTLETLEDVKMPYVGAGRNLEDASKPYYFVVDGKKIAVVAATQIERLSTPDTRGATDSTPGVFRCFDSTNLCNTLAEVKKDADFVILYVHWGTESTDQLDSWQINEAPKYADAGADLIIGDHPHVLQKIDYVGDVPVVYSLGNYWFNSKTIDTCLFTVSLNTEDASIKELRFEPCLQTNMSVKLLHDEEKDRVLNYMRSLSGNINIDDEGYITKK